MNFFVFSMVDNLVYSLNYITVDDDWYLCFGSWLQHTHIGFDMKLVRSGHFELHAGRGTLKPRGMLLVFFMLRVVGRCVPASYWKKRESLGVNCMVRLNYKLYHQNRTIGKDPFGEIVIINIIFKIEKSVFELFGLVKLPRFEIIFYFVHFYRFFDEFAFGAYPFVISPEILGLFYLWYK